MKKTKFNELIDAIYKKSPLQKKKLAKHLAEQDNQFFESAEVFASDYFSYLNSQKIPLEYAVNAYLKMCNDMLKCQVFFMKNGKYPLLGNAKEAFENVYNNEVEMKSLVIALAMSQFLWSTHYKMYQFLINNVKQRKENISSYLEIGPGHGLFLKDAYKILAKENSNFKMTALDISQTSMDTTKSIINHSIGKTQIEYIVMDMLDYEKDAKYDFISLGEVIEHVNFPDKLLLKFSKLLSDKGHGFISTCVDCPTIDHVYHFKSVGEIQQMIQNNGLIIEDELILPVEDLPMEEIVAKKITINYCAIVRREV